MIFTMTCENRPMRQRNKAKGTDPDLNDGRVDD